MTDIRRVGDAGVHTVEGNVAGNRAATLNKQRDKQKADYESVKNKIKEDNAAGIGHIDDKFSAGTDALEQEFRRKTVGLVSADDFRKAREEVNETKADAAVAKEARERRVQEERVRARESKRRKIASSLSFQTEEGEEEGGNGGGGSSSGGGGGGVGVFQKKPLKCPSVDTSYLPDRARDRALSEKKEALQAEWLERQTLIKNEMLEVVYSYWDGSGHRKAITLRKGTTVGRFLELVKAQLIGEFAEVRSTNPDDLVYVKEDLIIPHHYSFYDLIVTQARGKSGPLFHFDVHDDIRLINDATVEKDESHPDVCFVALDVFVEFAHIISDAAGLQGDFGGGARRKEVSARPVPAAVGSEMGSQEKSKPTGFSSLRGPSRCSLILVVLVVAVLWGLFLALRLTRNVMPEIDLVLNSQCKQPLRSWNGKVFESLPLWHNFKADQPNYMNFHNSEEYRGNCTDVNIDLPAHIGKQRPVILFATHHKTGTFLAKKLFSRICSRMQWCCTFHATRDSIHSVREDLLTEPINAMGHNQWIWHPQTLAIADYRFVHFYRHPYKKIISGYRYHKEGVEPWTQNALEFNTLCQSPLLHERHSPGAEVDRADVYGFCKGVHLCENCCRLEHQDPAPALSPTNSSKGGASVRMVKRASKEYRYLCHTLGRGAQYVSTGHFSHTDNSSTGNRQINPNPSLQQMLQSLPPREGVLVEAGLDYYEALRMATLISQTSADPLNRTLNIDIDDLSLNFAEVTRRMLQHFRGILTESQVADIHKDLAFYDLNSSPVYRWSMDNPFVNHLTGGEGGKKGLKGSAQASEEVSSKELFEALERDASVSAMYNPILKLMESVLKK
ncbi:XAP5, circadian clock regulator-domain-containing protein [Ochromonadaceae sp. CCMP2298]|nr:XAP5, circadian clock regulator-domain-containing protein [Ochromonadaceae sp. CCMP2298]